MNRTFWACVAQIQMFCDQCSETDRHPHSKALKS